jgi:hypothetical protein
MSNLKLGLWGIYSLIGETESGQARYEREPPAGMPAPGEFKRQHNSHPYRCTRYEIETFFPL